MAKDKILNFARIYDKVRTQMFYLTLFALTSILFFFAEKSYERSRIMFYTLSYAAIFLLAFVAGARDETVGTDIHVYGISSFNRAMAADSIIDGFGDSWIEPGFFIINYIAAHTYGGIGLSFFLQEFLIQVLALYGMKFFMKTSPLWLGMLIFNIVFYNHSFNLMRQTIAVAFILWSVRYLISRKFWKLIACIAFAAIFLHKTIVVAYAAYLIIYYAMGKNETEQKKLIVLTAIVGTIAVAAFAMILSYLASTVPYFKQFEAYGGGMVEEKSGFAPMLSKRALLYQLSLLFLIFALIHRGYNQMKQRYMIVFVILFHLGALMLGLFTSFATRIAYYFSVVETPLFIDFIYRTHASRPVCASLCGYMFFYELLFTIQFLFIEGWGCSYPYHSEILGI